MYPDFSFQRINSFSQWQKTASGLLSPTTTRYIRRHSGLIVPMSALEMQIEYFITKYDCIASYQLIPGNGEHPVHIHDKVRDVCRFCGKDKENDGETFPHNGHAISELIGNKSLFLDNECDTCNQKYGRKLEDQFAKYLGPARTIAQTIGKKGIPSYKNNDGTFRIDVTKTEVLIQDVVDSGRAKIYEDHVDFHLTKQTYTPIAAFKALVFMALSIMPEDEFKAFKDTVDWIKEESHEISKYNMSDYASHVIERFVPGPKPLPIQAFVARRKRNVYDAPYCFFVLEFDNFSFQIMVPCPEKDGVLWGQKITTFVFPSTYDIFEQEYKEYGYAGLTIKDMSKRSREVAEESNITIGFLMKVEDDSIKGKTAIDVAKEHGVKPIQINSR